MEKILNFKKKVLTLDINAMIDFFPGNPYYIGKDRNEEFNESIRKGNLEDYKGRLDKESYKLYKELVASEEVFHCYVRTMSETMLNNIYVEAQFSIGSLSLDRLNYELQIFESYTYEEFFTELDLLSSRFTNQTTDRRDKLRFKAIFKKHFKYSTPIVGKITGLFVNSLRDELKMRVKYLELLKKDIREMIAIKMEGVVNNVELINNKTVDLDYKGIFQNVAELAEDPIAMKAYFIRQQRKAERDHFYEKEDFYKGLLKLIVEEREKLKSFLSLANETLNVTSVGRYMPIIYTHEEIDLIEQIIYEICIEGKVEQTKTDEYSHYSALQWGAIIYYLNTEKSLPKCETVDDLISSFMCRHNIKLSSNTLRTRYYEAIRKITDTFDFKSTDLEKTIPFFEEHYKQLTKKIISEVEYLKEKEDENLDNQ